jgi:hypothetical protein
MNFTNCQKPCFWSGSIHYFKRFLHTFNAFPEVFLIKNEHIEHKGSKKTGGYYLKPHEK